ncbi:MAG: O-antigen ligase family protein [Candidatus Omnitrophica bacterium]|nr:O-antigen ligase family protein [Candidatus Omnitrophota bacterium]
MTALKVTLWCDRAMFFCLVPLVFFLPISTAILEICSGLIIFIYLAKRVLLFVLSQKQQKSPLSIGDRWRLFIQICKPVDHPLVLPVGIFFYAVFLSVIASQFPQVSWRGFFGKTVEAVFLFLAVVESINSRRRLNVMLSALLSSAIFIAIDGFYQRLFGKDFLFGHAFTSDERVSACFGHPNDLGGYLIIFVVLCVALLIWALVSRGEHRLPADLFIQGWLRVMMIGASVVLIALALGWTFSRGAWIGFGAGMIVLGYINLQRWYVPVIFCVLFFGVFTSQLELTRNVSFVTDNISSDKYFRSARLQKETNKKTKWQRFGEEICSELSRFSGAGRVGFWGETLHVIGVAPLFGTGLNTYSKAAERYNQHWTGYYSHNCYLQMLAEIGVVGLGAFFWVVFVLIRTSLGALRKMPLNFYSSVLAGLLAGWVGFLVHSALDTNFYSTKLANLMWIIMGLMAAVSLLMQKEAK